MYEIYVILFTFLSTIIVNFFLLKSNLLLDKKYSSHKSFLNKNIVPLSGGIIFLITICLFSKTDFYSFKLILVTIFLVGVFSDLNLISSPDKRLFIQIFIVSVFIYINNIYINSISWVWVDYYLQNTYLGYFLSLFCFVILINGTNFMDGVNILVIGYYLSISLIVLYIANSFNLEFNFNLTKIIVIILAVLFIFNFFGKLFLGDSGAYLISFVFGYILIDLSNRNPTVSSFFIACMLWYPAYENLFSIIRKIIKKKIPTKADNRHLHQLLYIFIKNKVSYSNNIINTLTGLIINFFNLLFFLQAAKNFDNTKELIISIVVAVLFYNFAYYYLSKKTNYRSN